MSNDNADLPANLVINPRFDRWLTFQEDETVRVATGKVEFGQGVVTALAQIAAEELDLSLEQIVMLSGDTDEAPDERYTVSSLSIMESGAAIRAVCAEARGLLMQRAVLRLNCNVDQLAVRNGIFLVDGRPSEISCWNVAPEIDWSQPPTGAIAPKPVSDYRIVGKNAPRRDLPAKLFGSAYIHDWLPDDVLHARTLRQPGREAALRTLDEAAIRSAAKAEIAFLRLKNFVAILGDDEAAVEAAAAAAATITGYATWDNAPDIAPAQQEAAWLRGKPSIDSSYGTPENAPEDSATMGDLVEAIFSRPYIAHASVAPSCALARFVDGHLTICSHGQGMHPLARNIADVLDLPEDAVTAKHLQGAGCYGHNGADDATLDAAIIAVNKPGRWVRLQWRRQEEFDFEPFGPAMLTNLRVRVDEAGLPSDWTAEIWSPTHVQRPMTGAGRLLASDALPEPRPVLPPTDPGEERGGGGTRNAKPYYDIPSTRRLMQCGVEVSHSPESR